MVKLLKLVLSCNVFITGSGKKERGVQRELLGVLGLEVFDGNCFVHYKTDNQKLYLCFGINFFLK